MKKIILISILICFIYRLGFSQDLIDTNIIILLDFYNKYKDECYNDSTFVKFFDNSSPIIESKNDSIDYTKIYGIPAVCIIKSKWKHKKPTFEGFMDFLEKKVNK